LEVKVIDVGTPGKLVSSVVSVCNRSDARRADSGKTTIS